MEQDEIRSLLLSISNTAQLGHMFREQPEVVSKTLQSIHEEAEKGLKLLESS